MKKEKLLKSLTLAEIQYKYTHALNIAYSVNESKPKLVYTDIFVWGKYTVHKADLQLNEEQEHQGVMLSSYAAKYLLCVQIDTILSELFGKERFKHTDEDIRAVSSITRLIRNAFTHNPFAPVWLIDRDSMNKIFHVKAIDLKLDTHGKHNRSLERSDYGGPLALLKISSLVKTLINFTS